MPNPASPPAVPIVFISSTYEDLTKTCFYLSFILLAASGLYEFFNIAYFDILGSLGIAYFAFKEGREAFEKAKSGNLLCSCETHEAEKKLVKEA